METPSSTRRVTRSQTSAIAATNSSNVLNSKKVEDVEKSRNRSGKKQQQDRSALIDITNDSPIVGLAMGNLETPSSAMSKRRVTARTPGSGEALLRGQVKTLLQRVEEEAEFSRITVQNRPGFNLQGLVNSPINLVAPTPANTPQVLNFSANGNGGLPSVTPSPVEERILISQMVVTEMFHGKKQEGIVESGDSITRSLMLDFIEKSQPSDSSESSSSVVTHQGQFYCDTESSVDKPSKDDDDASIWSIQVNVSSTRDDEECEEDCVEEEECDSLEYEEEEAEEDYCIGDGSLLDELCEGLSKISVNGASNFTGKHIRFTYDSDDELQGEEEASTPN